MHCSTKRDSTLHVNRIIKLILTVSVVTSRSSLLTTLMIIFSKFAALRDRDINSYTSTGYDPDAEADVSIVTYKKQNKM